jgi:hypothetical protein
MNKDIIVTVREFAEQMVELEHKYFVKNTIDNREHVPQIILIAEAANIYLSKNDVSTICCKEIREGIINYGRNLFIKEWMETYNLDDEDPVEEDAIDEFNKYAVTRHNKKKRGRIY